eukprot:XP_004919457.1 PREDICTED: platelet glycoprotein Ib alpha chain [Xenopus tropicalis]
MRRLLSLVLILLATWPACSPSCTTEKNVVKDKQETQCTHMALTSVPITDIHKDTAILILKYNDLKSVTASTFKGLSLLLELDLSNNAMTNFKVEFALGLEELNLANNSLDHIPNLSLLTNLNKLILSHNRITSVPDAAFHHLKNLQQLYLQHNGIHYLSEQVFEHSQQLHTLDLSYNKLVSVPRHLISHAEKLDKFYLTGNRLTEIPDDFFEGLANLAYVYLDDNPFQCNCALENFKAWVEDNSFNIYTMKDGDTTQDEYSVVCTSPNKVPLLNFPMDHCSNTGDNDYVTNTVGTDYVKYSVTSIHSILTTQKARLVSPTMLQTSTLTDAPTTIKSETTEFEISSETPTILSTLDAAEAATTTTAEFQTSKLTDAPKSITPGSTEFEISSETPMILSTLDAAEATTTAEFQTSTQTDAPTTIKAGSPEFEVSSETPMILSTMDAAEATTTAEFQTSTQTSKTSASRSACSHLCTTEKNVVKDKQETQCTHMGLTYIPLTCIPSNTSILILKYNDLTSITTSTLKDLPLLELDLSNNAVTSFTADFPLGLEELNLANNSINHIPDLSPLTNLKTLILSHNYISCVPDTAFHDLKNLHHLYLQHNGIHYLSEQVFERSQQLQTLDLSNNKLIGVPWHLISHAKKLDKFYLTGNRLMEIPDDFFEGLKNLAYVYLDDNPFRCNCASENFKTWVEVNAFNIYTIKDGATTQDEYSVVCASPYKVPLLNFSMDHCSTEPSKPITTTPTPYVQPTQKARVLSTTQVRVPTTELTTSTQDTPTTRSPQTPTVPTSPLVDAPLTTTLASEPSTLKLSTTIKTQTTLKLEMPDVQNTTWTKTVSPMVEEHSTPTIYLDTQVPVAPVGIGRLQSWLAEPITRYCCILHLLLYLLATLLVLLQVVVFGVWLVWACKTYYKHYHTLVDKPPPIWLIRARRRKDEAPQPHVAAQGRVYTGQTLMRVFEVDCGDQRNKFTSAIL